MNWLTSRCAPLVALAALALGSCDKGTDLNVDLPDTTAVSTEYLDLPVNVATVRVSPVQTLKADHYLVGRLSESIAGTTEARAYLNLVATNVVTGSTSDSLPSKLARPVLDSVVLVMGYDRVNGSVATPVRFDVFNLLAPLDEREPYNSGTATPVGAALGQNLVSRLDRTVRVKTDSTATSPTYYTTVPDQRVRLVLHRAAAVASPFAPAPAVASPFFSNTYFPALRAAGTFSQSQLDGLLKGLAVTPSAGYSSAVLSFGRSYNSYLSVFFHEDTVAAPPAGRRRKWRSYSVACGPIYSSGGKAPASSDPRYYTQITTDLTGTPLSPLAAATQAVPATALSGTSYLQEGIALGSRVTFTGLDQLRAAEGQSIIINRAELRVPVKPFTNALFPNPGFVYALEVDASNRILQRTVNFLPTDRVVQADGTNPLGTTNPAFGGLVDGASTQPYYSLLITSYLQAYLANKLEGNPTSLVLVPSTSSSASLSLNRAALDAGRISLRVYYSKR